MSEAAIRGSWTIHRGVNEKWTDSNLDAFVRGFDQWSGNANAGNFIPLNEGEARPETPKPYVVYDIDEPVTVFSDSGKEADQHTKQLRYRVRFEVHARKKRTAVEVGQGIANQFQDKALCVAPDTWVETNPVADVLFREADEHWVYRLIYDVTVNATYQTNRT